MAARGGHYLSVFSDVKCPLSSEGQHRRVAYGYLLQYTRRDRFEGPLRSRVLRCRRVELGAPRLKTQDNLPMSAIRFQASDAPFCLLLRFADFGNTGLDGDSEL
jgi:hypothetical protein